MKIDRLVQRVYARLLREAVPDLGKIQFSPSRVDGVSRREGNTPDEERLFGALQRWIEYGSGMYKDTAQDLRALMHDPSYKKFFKEQSDGDDVYRGISLSSEEVLKLMPDVAETILSAPSGSTELTFTLPLLRGRSGDSWTTNIQVAREFARKKQTEHRPISILLSTTVGISPPGTFLDLDYVISKAPSLDPLRYAENEVLALGPVTISSVEWRTL